MLTKALPGLRVDGREELRRVALNQFATVGFAATSLQQIADAAGYSKAAVLYHYSSKEALLEASIGPAVDQLEALGVTFAPNAKREAQIVFIERFVEFLIAHRLAVFTFVCQGQGLSDIPVIKRANDAIQMLAQAICNGTDTRQQLRFGVALAGAAYALIAKNSIDVEALPEIPESELRPALIAVLTELLVGE